MAAIGQKNGFQSRLKRISAGGENTMSQVYTGNGESVTRKAVMRAGKNRNRKPFAVQLINAFMIGVFSMVISRLALFHLVSENGVYSAEMLGAFGVLFAMTIGDVAIAALIALVALFLKKLLGQKLIFATALGFGVILIGEGQLLKAAPDFYAALYSPSYALEQMALQNATG